MQTQQQDPNMERSKKITKKAHRNALDLHKHHGEVHPSARASDGLEVEAALVRFHVLLRIGDTLKTKTQFTFNSIYYSNPVKLFILHQ